MNKVQVFFPKPMHNSDKFTVIGEMRNSPLSTVISMTFEFESGFHEKLKADPLQPLG